MSDDMPNGEWLSVPGYEGLYLVSSCGLVWTVRSQRLMKIGYDKLGYGSVVLSRNAKTWHARVHQLVAYAFLGPRPPGMWVCHGPRGAGCNEVSNLRYDTPGANSLDRWRDGTMRTRNSVKENCPRCGGEYQLLSGGTRRCPACRRENDRRRYREDPVYREKMRAQTRVRRMAAG